MQDYLRQKDIEDFRKHSHYKVGDRITYEVFGRRTGTIIKVTHPHVRASDGKEIPFHYTVRGDTDAPGASPDIVFPKDILGGPAVVSRPMNIYAGADRIVGSVDTDGNIYDRAHTTVGSVDYLGVVFDRTKRVVGSVTGIHGGIESIYFAGGAGLLLILTQ